MRGFILGLAIFFIVLAILDSLYDKYVRKPDAENDSKRKFGWSEEEIKNSKKN
jgi:hypothetical protein